MHNPFIAIHKDSALTPVKYYHRPPVQMLAIAFQAVQLGNAEDNYGQLMVAIRTIGLWCHQVDTLFCYLSGKHFAPYHISFHEGALFAENIPILKSLANEYWDWLAYRAA